MLKRVAIIGSGELAEQILLLLNDLNEYQIIGFYDDFLPKDSIVFQKFLILGRVENILSDYISGKFDYLMLAIGYNHMKKRKEIFKSLSKDIPFATLIHNSCYIGNNVSIGQGSVIYPGCVIDKNVIIGENVLLNLGVTIAHDCRIESNSFFAPRVVVSGFVNFGESCFIGTGSIVVDNLTIGNQVIIGAGTVVVNDLPSENKYVGNPARILSNTSQ